MFFLWVETLPDQKRQSLFPNSRVCACVWGGGGGDQDARADFRSVSQFHWYG